MFEEVDYLQEGQNAERFGRLYGLHTPNSTWLMFASINHHTHSKEKG
jgi:predicted unusual protein kinase regulating ubiquinone biosynthesis (AarF/ABC1/UbiB family)